MMSITRKQYNLQCTKFITDCKDIGENWSLQGEKNETIRDVNSVIDNNVRLMLSKQILRKQDGSDEILSHEYNVIYSDSFEVPVMYFTISEQNGSPLSCNKILSTLIGFAGKDLNQVVHQVEHPVLFRPFFMIHPCRTKQFMEPHKKLNLDCYLVCWLSSVGAILGLNLDYRFAYLNAP